MVGTRLKGPREVQDGPQRVDGGAPLDTLSNGNVFRFGNAGAHQRDLAFLPLEAATMKLLGEINKHGHDISLRFALQTCKEGGRLRACLCKPGRSFTSSAGLRAGLELAPPIGIATGGMNVDGAEKQPENTAVTFPVKALL